MSLADITAKAMNRLVDKAGDPAWVDSAVKAGKQQINSLPRPLQGKADRFLNEMLKEREDLAHAGRYTFGLIVGHLQGGKVDEAKALFLRDRATPEERRRARDEAHTTLVAEVVDREKTWETAKRVGELALELGQHALPFVLAFI